MGSDSIPPKLKWEYKLRSSLWTDAFHCTDSKDSDIYVLDGKCWQQKHTQHAPSTKTECDYLNSWIQKWSHTQNLTQNGEPQRYSWGMRKRKKLYTLTFPQNIVTVSYILFSYFKLCVVWALLRLNTNSTSSPLCHIIYIITCVHSLLLKMAKQFSNEFTRTGSRLLLVSHNDGNMSPWNPAYFLTHSHFLPHLPRTLQPPSLFLFLPRSLP